VKTFLVGCVVLAAESLVGAWLLMVVVGIVHGEWLPQVPTVGYGGALILAIAIDVLLAVRAIFTAIGKALVGDES
jgi:hypothetical protein